MVSHFSTISECCFKLIELSYFDIRKVTKRTKNLNFCDKSSTHFGTFRFFEISKIRLNLNGKSVSIFSLKNISRQIKTLISCFMSNLTLFGTVSRYSELRLFCDLSFLCFIHSFYCVFIV